MYPGSVTRLSEKVIASADSIVADVDVLILTGTTTVNTITPKANQFGNASQILFIIPPDGQVTLGTSGNIAVGLNIPQNRMSVLIYSRTTGDWHIQLT